MKCPERVIVNRHRPPLSGVIVDTSVQFGVTDKHRSRISRDGSRCVTSQITAETASADPISRHDWAPTVPGCTPGTQKELSTLSPVRHLVPGSKTKS